MTGDKMVIRSTARKALFVLALVVFNALLTRVLSTFDITRDSIVMNVASSIWSIGAIAVGARLFRGPGESDEPRPWWRFTNRVRLSALLGSLFVLLTVISLAPVFIDYPIGAPSASVPRLSRAQSLIDSAQLVVVAFLYLNSAVRLSRRPAQTSVEESKLAPKINS